MHVGYYLNPTRQFCLFYFLIPRFYGIIDTMWSSKHGALGCFGFKKVFVGNELLNCQT